ncbi:MAG TPA: hypothetical protein VFZ56_00645 [Gemmatimonadaceae bacterium]
MLERIKARLPRSLKRAVRQRVLDPFLRQASDRRLRKLVNSFRADPSSGTALLEQFRRAWGNESFSADVTYVSEVVSHVSRCSAPVLECGSGLTTLVAGLAAERRGVTVLSLEQDREWAEFVTQRLRRNAIHNVEVRYAPLRDYGGFVWYDVETVALPERFELVLCDGPAVFEEWGEAHAQWRYGVLPVLAARSVRVDRILLDDATEPRAARLLRRWQQAFGMSHTLIQASDGDCAVVNPGAEFSGGA